MGSSENVPRSYDGPATTRILPISVYDLNIGLPGVFVSMRLLASNNPLDSASFSMKYFQTNENHPDLHHCSSCLNFSCFFGCWPVTMHLVSWLWAVCMPGTEEPPNFDRKTGHNHTIHLYNDNGVHSRLGTSQTWKSKGQIHSGLFVPL